MRMNDDDFPKIPIPHVKLTSDQKHDFGAIMEKSSSIIFELAAKAKKNFKKTNAHEKFSKAKFRAELFKQLKGKAIDCKVFGVKVSAKQAEHILEVKKIENEILAGYSKLIYILVRKWNKRRKNSSIALSFMDLWQEAVFRATDCIYGFNNSNLFTTYLTHAITRRLQQVLIDNGQFGGLTNNAVKLHERYTKLKASINGPVDFDQLCTALKLKPKEKKNLRAMTAKVISESSVNASQEEGGTLFDEVKDNSIKDRLDFDQRQAVAKAGLTTWEQAVLDAYLSAPFETTKWVTEVSSKNINPNTGTNYSRVAPQIALKRAIQKVRFAYQGHTAVI